MSGGHPFSGNVDAVSAQICTCFENNDNSLLDALKEWQRSLKGFRDSLALISNYRDDERVMLIALSTIQLHILERWPEVSDPERGEVVATLMECVRGSCLQVKTISVLADIVLFEPNVIESVLEMCDALQAVFFVCLIDEAYAVMPRFRTPREMSDFMLAMAPLVAGLLERIEVTPTFIDLLKRFIHCISRIEMLSPFFEKFTAAIDVLPSKASEFVCAVFDTAPPIASHVEHCVFAQRMMEVSVKLAHNLVAVGQADLAIDVWYSIMNYEAVESEEQKEKRLCLIAEFLSMGRFFVDCAECVFLHSLVSIIASDLMFCERGTDNLKHQLLLLLLDLGNREYSDDLDQAFSDLLSEASGDISDALHELLRTSPGPGLILAAVHCKFDENVLFEFAQAAIAMRELIPFKTMMRFLSQIGVKFPQLHEMWFSILASHLHTDTLEIVSVMSDMMWCEESVKLAVPDDIYQFVAGMLHQPSPGVILTAARFLCEYHFPNPLPEAIFSDLKTQVVRLCEIAISTDDVTVLMSYFAFLSQLANCRLVPDQARKVLADVNPYLVRFTDGKSQEFVAQVLRYWTLVTSHFSTM